MQAQLIIDKGLTMIGFNALNDVLLKNPALSAISIIVLFVAMQWTTLKTQDQVTELNNTIVNLENRIDDMVYEDSELLVARGFSGILDPTGLIDKLNFWITNDWDAQLAAVEKLCSEPDRTRLVKHIGSQAATSICRAAR
jgi:hypothetical protein